MKYRYSIIAAAVALVLITPAVLAAIAYQDENSLNPNSEAEIWFEIYDEANARSYTLDTGIKLKEMVANPGAFYNRTFDVAAAGLPAANGVWGVFGVQEDNFRSYIAAGNNPQSPANATGMLTTVDPNGPALSAGDVTVATYWSFQDVDTRFVSHVQFINEKDTVSTINFIANLFHTFKPSDSGYFTNSFGPDYKQAVAFKAVAPTGASQPFYFLTVNEDENFNLQPVIGHNGQPLGTWNFNGSILSFVAVGSPTPSPSPSPTPGASASPSPSPTPGASASPSPSPTPGASASPTPSPSPTPTATPTPGPVALGGPTGDDVLRVKGKRAIAWSTTAFPKKQRLKLEFSKDGGNTWKLLKTGLRLSGKYNWKPKKSQITEQGKLRICPVKKPVDLCTYSSETFAIRP